MNRNLIISFALFLLFPACAMFERTKEPRLVWVHQKRHIMLSYYGEALTPADFQKYGFAVPSEEDQKFERRCYRDSLYMVANRLGTSTSSNPAFYSSCMEVEGWKVGRLDDEDLGKN